jgi:hypothetical protein
MGGAKDNQCRVVRAQRSEPRSVFIVLVGREEAEPLGFPNQKYQIICKNASLQVMQKK